LNYFSLAFSNLHVVLPIKPKPLLYPKDSTLLSDSNHNLKGDQITGDTIFVSFGFFCLIHQRYSLAKNKRNYADVRLKIESETNQLHVVNINHQPCFVLFLFASYE